MFKYKNILHIKYSGTQRSENTDENAYICILIQIYTAILYSIYITDNLSEN